MTNLEYIRTCSETELSKLLCGLMCNGEVVACPHCIAEENCRVGHIGFEDWLKEDIEG